MVKTELEQVSSETMRFMRGKYALDEVSDGKDELKFRRGGRTVLTIYIRDDRYDFLIIFGKVERTEFEAQQTEFSPAIRALYDAARTYHDGKWMMISVRDLATLNEVKRLIMIKKKPNRKPLPRERAIYSDCGHRCDLCVHYTGETVSAELLGKMRDHVRRVYGAGTFPPCTGCSNGGYGGNNDCPQKECAKTKGKPRCMDCAEYDCGKATAGLPPAIEMRNLSADDVTWAILPYVAGQYGN